jgi:hypothetical protein
MERPDPRRDDLGQWVADGGMPALGGSGQAESLPVVARSDPRIGATWISKATIGALWAQSKAAGEAFVRHAGLRPVAVVEASGEFLYSRAQVDAAGLIPDVPFDPETEVRLTAFARERGTSTNTVLIALEARLRRRDGKADSRREQLERGGVGRKLRDSWVIRRAAVEELLQPPYDPDVEATLDELIEEFEGYTSKATLAASLRGGGVPMRKVLDVDGRDRLVVDRGAAREWLTARVPRRTPLNAPPRESAPTWRHQVGPIRLTVPTNVRELDPEAAAWILGQPSAATDARRTPMAVSELEATLLRRDDFLGLVLLARLLEGRLPTAGATDRITALVG